MANFNSNLFHVREMCKCDSTLMHTLALRHYKSKENDFPWILSKSLKGNIDLTHAYVTNKEIYPYAYVLSCDEDIGCLVTQLSSGNVLDVSIVLLEGNTAQDVITLLNEFKEFIGEKYIINFSSHDKSVNALL